jgi:hypothetical protein
MRDARFLAAVHVYAGHEALDPAFEVVRAGLKGSFKACTSTKASPNAVFEFLYEFPDWPSSCGLVAHRTLVAAPCSTVCPPGHHRYVDWNKRGDAEGAAANRARAAGLFDRLPSLQLIIGHMVLAVAASKSSLGQTGAILCGASRPEGYVFWTLQSHWIAV